jgi:tetratricopeptide (TPR) repeat protein
MTKKKLLYVLLLLPVCAMTYGQTYQMKTPFDIKQKMEILNLAKEVFDINANLSYNISTHDPVANFSGLADQEPYDVNYFQKQKKLWEADSLNPICANNLGNYYNFHEKYDSAALFFRKSIDKLNIKYFNNDSAFYLSMRGMLKLNLGRENPIADFDQALKINTNDSIARLFYPLLLMNNQDFKKATEVCIRMLEDPKADPVFPYVMLITSELGGSFATKIQEANADEKIRASYANTDYDKLLNFALIDKYAEKYKTNNEVRSTRYMADIFALTVKLAFFQEVNKPESVFPYTVNEKARLAFLEKTFLVPAMRNELNPYTLNKCLGFVYFMQQQKDKAIVVFKEAIKAFPESKKWQYFNPAEMYDALSAVYFINKDTARFVQILIDKIAAEPGGKKEVNDYFFVAEHYLRADDLKKAEEWANKGVEVNANNFDILRLLAHLNFLNGKSDLVQSYADKAIKLAQTNQQQYNLALQFAFYQLFNGDATSAHNNIEIARKAIEGQTCEICDRVVAKYIVITK